MAAGMLRARSNWRKSSYSATNAYCVEVAVTAGAVAVRDTKDRDGGVIAFRRCKWAAFLGQLKAR